MPLYMYILIIWCCFTLYWYGMSSIDISLHFLIINISELRSIILEPFDILSLPFNRLGNQPTVQLTVQTTVQLTVHRSHFTPTPPHSLSQK